MPDIAIPQRPIVSYPRSVEPVLAAGPFGVPSRTALALGFALVALAGLATIYMTLRTAEADRWVSHTFIVRDHAASLLESMEKAETGQRGYLLTHDPAYLEPYVKATASIPVELDALHLLTVDNPQQQTRLTNLSTLFSAGMNELARSIALERAGQHAAAVSHAMNTRNKAGIDSIRTIISAFSSAELTLLNQRQGALKSLQNWTRIYICASLAGALLLAAVLARWMLDALDGLRTRTSELETEIQLRQSAEGTLRQAQKMEAVGQLSGGIAHDFNNLLTIVMGNLDTIKRRLSGATRDATASDLAQALARPVDAALYGTQKSAELVHRLLAFSRRQMLEPARIDLNRLVAGLTDMLHRTLGETIDVETILGVGLWATFADANQVENALVNLCVNARDAMPDGGRLTIETANVYLDEAYARQFGDVTPGQYVMVAVTDTGSGFTSGNLARAFEPFFTTKPTGQGTGLGLAMVHGFVKQSGGHIRIYSEPGSGTTVKMYLPRLAETQTMASAPMPKPFASMELPRARDGETILIVEDNEGVRQYALSVLHDLGYSVIEARNADEALTAFESALRVDLLFTDVVLPGASGRDLAGRIAALRPGIPVLFTTGYSRNAIIHNGRLDADVQLISKPYTQFNLARKIRELLDDAQA